MNQIRSDRRFHRVQMRAPVRLTNQQQQTLHGICLNFSEDGLDLEPDNSMTLFNDFQVRAGDIVTLQVEQLEQAPNITAAVIKVSPTLIGLRFLN